METVATQALKTHRTWKHHLPSYFQLKCFNFDIEKIQKDVLRFSDQFADIFETNQDLCRNHPNLAESVQDHYEQVSLTTFNPDLAADRIKNLKTQPIANPQSKTDLYRLKTQPRVDKPRMDERNYNLPTQLYRGSYIEECINSFNEDPMRVRLVKLKPGKKVDFHIDYDPSFAMRIVVPVFTNKKVFNYTKRSNQIESIHLTADGSPWFLNTGFSHAAENLGDTERVILMFSLTPSDLLLKISKAWKAGETALSQLKV